MADLSSSEFKTSVEYVTQLDAGITAVTAHTTETNTQLAAMATALEQMSSAISEIGKKPLIDPKSVESAKTLEEFMIKMPRGYAASTKQAEKLFRITKDLASLKKKINDGDVSQIGKTLKLMQEAEKLTKKIGKNAEASSKIFKVMGFSSADFKTDVKSVATTVTGLNLSLGGLIGMIVEAANEMRKIAGLSAKAASHLGDGKTAIASTTRAMMGLRSTFRTSYDEAGEVVNQITAMGFAADALGTKEIAPKDLAKVTLELNKQIVSLENKIRMETKSRGLLSAINQEALRGLHGQKTAVGLTEERAKAAEKVKKENEQIAHTNAQQVSLTKELYALQVKFGISIQQSGGFVKNLQLDYGKNKDEARELLGTAIATGIELRKHGAPIGIQDVLKDWSELIEKTKVYKTDLYGVLALYNIMMKKDLAKKLGLEGVATNVKKDIAKSLTSMALDMEIGWKARLGTGSSPAERALNFEKLLTSKNGQVEGFAAIIKEVEGMVGDIKAQPAEAEIRARALFESIMPGISKETTIALGKQLVEGKLSSKSMKVMITVAEKERELLEKSAKDWKKARPAMIASAAQISTATQSIQDLIKKWVVDTLIPIIQSILETLTDIYYALPYTGTDPNAKRKVEEGRFRIVQESLGNVSKTSVDAAADAYGELARNSIRAALEKNPRLGAPGKSLAENVAAVENVTKAQFGTAVQKAYKFAGNTNEWKLVESYSREKDQRQLANAIYLLSRGQHLSGATSGEKATDPPASVHIKSPEHGEKVRRK